MAPTPVVPPLDPHLPVRGARKEGEGRTHLALLLLQGLSSPSEEGHCGQGAGARQRE